MEVDGAHRGHGPNYFGQHAEGDNDLEVGFEGAQFFEEGGIFELLRLEDGDIFRQCVLFHGAAGERHATAGLLVRGSDYSNDIVPRFEDGVQGGDGEFGSTHEDDAGTGGHSATIFF